MYIHREEILENDDRKATTEEEYDIGNFISISTLFHEKNINQIQVTMTELINYKFYPFLLYIICRFESKC